MATIIVLLMAALILFSCLFNSPAEARIERKLGVGVPSPLLGVLADDYLAKYLGIVVGKQFGPNFKTGFKYGKRAYDIITSVEGECGKAYNCSAPVSVCQPIYCIVDFIKANGNLQSCSGACMLPTITLCDYPTDLVCASNIAHRRLSSGSFPAILGIIVAIFSFGYL